MTSPEAIVTTLLGAGAATAAYIAGRKTARRPPEDDESSHSLETDDGFERLLAELPLAAILLDVRGTVCTFNVAAESVFDVKASFAIGRALIEAVPSVELERIASAALGGSRITREVTIGMGRRELTLAVHAYPSSSSGGATLLGVDRTTILESERARGDFISNVSHELRTPLSAIKLMVETVMVSPGDEETSALFLPQVNREVDRMVQLVEDLLELARSESGKLPMRRERLDLVELARKVAATVVRRAESQGVDLEVIAKDRVWVEADPDRLTQILVNLLDNALRHTPVAGSITVEVATAGHEALLSVRDTGAGIPYKDLPRIFERFYVVDRSRNRGRTGTGLGLSIVKQLVEVHGGRIEAHSTLGSGSTFVCRFPRLVTAPAEQAKA